jgi:hypothetical protein
VGAPVNGAWCVFAARSDHSDDGHIAECSVADVVLSFDVGEDPDGCADIAQDDPLMRTDRNGIRAHNCGVIARR